MRFFRKKGIIMSNALNVFGNSCNPDPLEGFYIRP